MRASGEFATIEGTPKGLEPAAEYSPLANKPLHRETLADLHVEYEAALALTFECVRLLGRQEAGEASDEERACLRLLTPLAKLFTAKQAVALASEALEGFGGAGYIEDTGLPAWLRDAQVLPIWEGTTNVLSIDTLRALGKGGALEAVAAEIEVNLASATDASLAKPVEIDAEHRETGVPVHASVNGLVEPLLEKHAVGQAREGIVSGEIGHLCFGRPPLRHVLVGLHPATVGHRPVRNVDDAPVHQF